MLVWIVKRVWWPITSGGQSANQITTWVILLWRVPLLLCMSSCGVTLCALHIDLVVSLCRHSGCASTNNQCQTLITASTPRPTMQSRKRTGTEILAEQLTVISLSPSDCLSLFGHVLCCTFHYSQALQMQYWLISQLYTTRLFQQLCHKPHLWLWS